MHKNKQRGNDPRSSIFIAHSLETRSAKGKNNGFIMEIVELEKLSGCCSWPCPLLSSLLLWDAEVCFRLLYSVLALAWQQYILATVVKFRAKRPKCRGRNAKRYSPRLPRIEEVLLPPDLLSANETGHLAKLITPLHIKFPGLATNSLSPMISRSGHSSYLPRAQLVAMLERGRDVAFCSKRCRNHCLTSVLQQRCGSTALPSGRRWDCSMSSACKSVDQFHTLNKIRGILSIICSCISNYGL